MNNKIQWNSAGKIARAFVESKLSALGVIAITLIGLLALFGTPREYNPQITVPAATIMVMKPGANPEETQNLVVKPLEALMHALPGVEHSYAYAGYDFGMVTVQFKVGEDQERSLVRVYNQMMQNRDRMPPGTMEPLIKAVNVDDVPILSLTLSSETMNEEDLRSVSTAVLEQLRSVPGVSASELIGGAPRAIQVRLDPAKLQSLNLSLNQVDQMLSAANMDLPAGDLVQGGEIKPIRVLGALENAEDLRNLIVGAPGGRPVHLGEIAQVVDASLEHEVHARMAWGKASAHPSSGEVSATTLSLAKKAGTNAVTVSNAVLAKLEEIKAHALPEGVQITVTRNDGAKANDAVNTLVEHLGIAIASVVLILIVFLGWREAAIVTLTVPLILFVVLGVGYGAGQTINRITLFALILSLGLLVDAAIVVIENIHRHMHGKKHRNFKELLIYATNEIGNPTNVATLAVILAFLPMAFVTGMMGPFMRPIPINVPVAMLASLLIAYAIVPWAARIWLSSKANQSAFEHSETMEEHGSHPQDFLHRLYVKTFQPFMHSKVRRIALYAFVIATLGAALLQPAWQFIRPQGIAGPLSAMGVELKMLPYDNTNTFLIQVDAPEGMAAAETDRRLRDLGDLLRLHPAITDYQSYLGMAAPEDFGAIVRGDKMRRGENFAQVRINLVDQKSRSTSSHEIVQEINLSLQSLRNKYPETRFKLYETPPGPPVQAQIMAEIYGPNQDKLHEIAAQVENMFASSYGMINADASSTAPQKDYRIRVNHAKALSLGIAPAQVAGLLHQYLSGQDLGTLRQVAQREAVQIQVRLPMAWRENPQQILDLRLSSASGALVPLGEIATLDSGVLQQARWSRDGKSLVKIGGELLQSSPVYAVLGMDQKLDQKQIAGVQTSTGNLGFSETPAQDLSSYHILWGGEMRLTLDVFRDLGSAFMVALVLIYLLLVAYYKNFVLPLLVMGAIPMTLIGVFPGHWITGQAFTATSMIGVIALAGIVVRNSLLLIDFILEYRKEGHPLAQAVLEAGAARFRPILLTALAIILGSAIMITDPVFGGLAVSLIFGTFASTALTLIVIPLVYFLWQKGKES